MPSSSSAPPPPIPQQTIDELANRLAEAAGRSLVVCGEQDLNVQKLCNFINHLLGNYGATLDIAQPSSIRLGRDADLVALVDEMKQGKIGALLIHDANPIFELPENMGFADAIKEVELVVQFATRPDDTTACARFVCPIPHFLESWNDYETRPGLNSIAQPAIQPLFDTRPLMETLSAWTSSKSNSRELIERRWQSNIYPQIKERDSFRQFFH